MGKPRDSSAVRHAAVALLIAAAGAKALGWPGLLPGVIYLLYTGATLYRQRQQAEDRLSQSEDQLRAMIESALDGVMAVDAELQVILFNPAAEKMFGYTAAEALGQPLNYFLPERCRNTRDGHIRRFAKTAESGRNAGPGGPLLGLRSNGEEFPIEVSLSRVDLDGKTMFTAIVRDVTDRERTHAALREQAQLLDLAQVMIRDVNGSIVLWNQGAQQLYGFSKDEAVGRLSHDLLHTEFPNPLALIEEKLLAAGRWEGELVHRRRDGTRIVVSSVWVLSRDAANRPIRVLEANTDITARKHAENERARAEQALRAQSRMLHSVLDNIGEGLIAADEHGKFVLWNRAAETLLGKGPADVPPEAWTEHYGLFLPDSETPFPWRDLPLVRALQGEAAFSEMAVHGPKIAWVEGVARPLKDENGATRGGVFTLRDVTKRKADEREIRSLNEDLERRVAQRTEELLAANKEMESFTYSVSHDLRAPLRHIAGFTGMLAEELGPSLDARSKRLLQRIEDGTRTMGQMVDELLSLARVGRQAPNLQVTALGSIVEEVLGVLRADCENRQIEWRIGPLPYVECDATLVRLVFQNLISNAVKYSRPRSPAIIEIGKTGGNAIFVRDNGVGFSMKYADKLFGVFQRLHRAEDFEGTGVGLATVQRIVQKHGGRIWVEAELDRGATFYFTLSSAEERTTEEQAEHAYETS